MILTLKQTGLIVSFWSLVEMFVISLVHFGPHKTAPLPINMLFGVRVK